MKIAQWFDVNNISHLNAYRYLEKKGFWPAEFISDDMEFENGWQILVLSKLADAWLDERLGKTVESITNISNEHEISIVCKRCGDEHITKAGYQAFSGGKIQMFQCQGCGHRFRGDNVNGINELKE